MSSRVKLISAIIAILVIGAAVFLFTGNEPEAPMFTDEPINTAPKAIDRSATYYDDTMNNDSDTVAPSASVTEEPPAPEPDPRLIPPPADLTDSDPVVASAITVLSPKLSQWLIPEEQIRKWVLAVDLIADGKLPKRYRPIDYPMSKFDVAKSDEQLVAAEQNHARMNALLDALEAIDTDLLAEFYASWKPVLAEAYREQGKPGSIDQRVQLAISQILAVSPPPENAELKRPGVLYVYEDEQLEVATDIEKLLWRMGEENTQRLQSFARELRSALEEQP